jgi:hypothetical protein
MDIFQDNPNGGTFTIFSLDINARFTFTEHGNPSNEPDDGPLDLSDILSFFDGPSGTGQWSHNPPPNDAHNAMFPAGNFYVTDPDVEGNIFSLTLAPAAIPEPRAWLMLGAVLTGVGVVHVTRRWRLQGARIPPRLCCQHLQDLAAK